MQVTRTLHIEAPAGHAVHATGACYAAPAGRRLVESVVHHAFDGRVYFTARAYRRTSDDNGRTWTAAGAEFGAEPAAGGAERTAPRHVLDAARGILVGVYSDWLANPAEDQFSGTSPARTYRIRYELSRDEGRTWEAPRQVVHRGAGFDETRWLPGVTFGRNGAYAESAPPAFLDDGTLVVGYVAEPVDGAGNLLRPAGAGYWFETGFLRGRWNADASALEWEAGERIRVPTSVSSVGCCEPDLLLLGGRRLFATLRCQGAGGGPFSSRQGCLSEDGGLTWTAPKPLAYEDGTPVPVPAAFSGFLRSPRTGKAYWLANILAAPVRAQYPRHPLAIAEFDEERLCLLKRTVRVVQGLPAGAPPCVSEFPASDEECGRQYTNFGAHVDRETGELVVTVPEMPKTSWADFTSDCLRLRLSDL